MSDHALVTLDAPPGAALARPGPAQGAPPAMAYLARLRSEASRRAMRWKLDRAAALLSGGQADALAFPWASLSPSHVSALASALVSDDAKGPGAGPYSARTVNATMAAVRGVLREAWRGGMIDRERLARLVDGTNAEPVTGEPAGRAVAPGEVAALFAAAAADPVAVRGARDAAALALLFGAGLRAGEAVALDWSDLDREREAVAVLRGKGRKARTVELAAGSLAALDAWRAVLAESLAPEAVGGPLLRVVNKGGGVGGRWPVRGVQRATARLAAAAGVEDWTPHDARRTYAGDLLDAGADIVNVQRLMGHSDPATTARYDRRPAEARRRAARLLRVPYRRGGGS